jgi:surface protein
MMDWFESDNYCVGTDLYKREVKRVSFDGGNTWSDMGYTDENGVTTYEYRSSKIESNSCNCGVIGCDNYISFEFTGDTTTYKLNKTTYTATSSPYSATLDDLGIETLTSCNSAFSGSTITNLTSFPDTSNVTDMDMMFYFCSGLTTLDVSNFNTSAVTKMNRMFWNCRNLISLDVSNFNTSNVINMDYMFSACSGLTSLDLSSFDTSNVTNMNNMFDNCSNLTSLDVSNFNTSAVTSMSSMFFYCSGLTSLDLSSFDTSNVTSMNYMFRYCSGLTTLDVSNFNTSAVTQMSYMFDNCRNLTSLDVSNFNTSAVTKMSSMFNTCSGLTSLDLSSFDTSNVTSMNNMFNNCSNLTSLDVSSWDVGEHITFVGNMFYGCTSLQTLRVKQGTYDWWCDRLSEAGLSCNIIEEGGGINKGVFKVTYSAMSNNDNNGERIFKFNEIEFNTLSTGTLTTNADNTYTYEVNIYEEENISEPITQLTSLKNFFNLETDAIIHNIPDTSNVTNMYYMFNCWTSNTKLTFDPTQFNTSSLTTLGRNFYSYKVNGDYLDLRSWDVSKVTSFATSSYSSIFSRCFSDTIDIRGWNFASTNSLKWLFGNFYGLEILQDLDTSNVTDMESMFITCTAMTSLDISNFNTSACTNMSYMFQNCSGLTSLDLSNFNTSNVSKMVGIFQNCSVINSLDVSSWDVNHMTNSSFYRDMFSGCASLNNLYIKQGTRDWWYARLTDASIQNNVTIIEV